MAMSSNAHAMEGRGKLFFILVKFGPKKFHTFENEVIFHEGLNSQKWEKNGQISIVHFQYLAKNIDVC